MARARKGKERGGAETAVAEAPRPTVTIDYPQEGEEIAEGPYSIRISAEPNSEVQLSINNGEWQPCRQAAGYYWFDWIASGPDRCKMSTRARTNFRTWQESAPRLCLIKEANEPMNFGLTR